MAVTQSQYNFIKFAANGDALNFKGLLVGFILAKTNNTSVGRVQIQNFAKTMEIIPSTPFLSQADPLTVVQLKVDGMPVQGLHVTICSNMNVIAMIR